MKKLALKFILFIFAYLFTFINVWAQPPACTITVNVTPTSGSQPSRVIYDNQVLCINGPGNYNGSITVNNGGHLVVCGGNVWVVGSVAIMPGATYWRTPTSRIRGSMVVYGTTSNTHDNCSSPDPEIEVVGNGIEIADGDASPSNSDDTDFGSLEVGGITQQRTYTINNTGDADLIISGNITSSDIQFTVGQPSSPTITAGGSETFTVNFDPTAASTSTSTITINNNDNNEDPYTFSVQGVGTITSTPCNVQTDLVVADGNVPNIDLPIDCYYNYSYSEQIYLQTQIATPGNITELSFKYNGHEAFTDDIKIYMGHTSKSSYGSTLDWVTSAGMTEVYDGTISVTTTDGWVTVILDTPFSYNDIDNLVIGVDENTPTYHSSLAHFYSQSTGTSRSIVYSNDFINTDPASPSSGYVQNYVASLKLTMASSSSPTIATVNACDNYTWIDGITYTSSTNSPTHTLTDAAGCDSVVSLDLTINNSNTGTDVITSSGPYTWIDGVTYIASTNTPTQTLTNAVGCDSVITLDLTITSLPCNLSSTLAENTSAGLNTDAGDNWSGSWGDYDNDGYDDLFVPNKDINSPSILYQNNGDGTFSKVTTGDVVTDLGGTVSGAWGDYDNDGYLDLFVCNSENAKNRLYHNNGDGTFSSVTNNPLVDMGNYSHSAAWADYNRDGNLDLAVSDIHATDFNLLFYGDGAGGFTHDATAAISLSAKSSVGLAWADYDNDNDLDLFIANTNGENNQLFENVDGNFSEITTGDIVTDGGTSVGASWGDYDNDGDLDLFVTNASILETNCFYQNQGNGTFTKITSLAITADYGNSHGANWIDYNNDAHLDLFVANNQGGVNYLYKNNGDGTFTSETNPLTQTTTESYGGAWADVENDGDYDVFVANIDNGVNELYISPYDSCTNYLTIGLVGCNSNSFGIGAKVQVKAAIDGIPTWQTKAVSNQNGGLAGQNSPKLLFGLGQTTTVDSVIVNWPSGMVTELAAPTANQLLEITEECGSRISGYAFHDIDGDLTQDSNEPGIPNQKLTIAPNNYTVYTNSSGYYEFYVSDGTYDISQVLGANWTQTFPAASASHTLTTNYLVQPVYAGYNFANDPNCADPDLELSMGTTAFRRGLTNELDVVIANVGVGDLTSPATLTLTFTDNVYLVGGGWDNVSNLVPGYRSYEYNFSSIPGLTDTLLSLIDSVDNTAAIDDIVTADATISYPDPECNTANNSSNLTDVVVGSIDPNDKLVFVKGKGVQDFALRSDVLEYKIRFQNVGNYAARRVHIEDQLTEDLNWSTFEFVKSSHNFNISLVDGLITIDNPNIELPDSLSDPEGSQGYVLFNIRPNQNVDPFTLIKNKASIVFDYNEPLITNTTQMVIVPNNYYDQLQVFAYPNPTNGETEILLLDEESKRQTIASITLFNISGNKIMGKMVNAENCKLNLTALEPGIYVAQVFDFNGNKRAVKVVKSDHTWPTIR